MTHDPIPLSSEAAADMSGLPASETAGRARSASPAAPDPIRMVPVAHIETDLPEKFGVPRQSGLADLPARIVMEPAYRDPEAFRGLEGFSHLWLVWLFSEVPQDRPFCATVRPPRLGGNERVGVFASRSPFRPNRIGLSCVRLKSVEQDPRLGPVLYVTGADLMSGTPILDIKPYLPFTDSRPEALSGFTQRGDMSLLKVVFPEKLLEKLPKEKRKAAAQVLAQDPRPRYQEDPERIYGMTFAGSDIRFRVEDHVLTVCSVEPLPDLHEAGNDRNTDVLPASGGEEETCSERSK